MSEGCRWWAGGVCFAHRFLHKEQDIVIRDSSIDVCSSDRWAQKIGIYLRCLELLSLPSMDTAIQESKMRNEPSNVPTLHTRTQKHAEGWSTEAVSLSSLVQSLLWSHATQSKGVGCLQQIRYWWQWLYHAGRAGRGMGQRWVKDGAVKGWVDMGWLGQIHAPSVPNNCSFFLRVCGNCPVWSPPPLMPAFSFPSALDCYHPPAEWICFFVWRHVSQIRSCWMSPCVFTVTAAVHPFQKVQNQGVEGIEIVPQTFRNKMGGASPSSPKLSNKVIGKLRLTTSSHISSRFPTLALFARL